MSDPEPALLGEIEADIAIDVHEPLDLIEALTKSGKKIRVESLPTDIMIPGEPGLALERKSAGDFISTFTSDRFADQMIMLKTLKETGLWRVGLLLEGSLTAEMKFRKMSPLAIQHMETSVTWGWDIPVYRVEKKEFTASTLLYLADKISGKKSFVPLRKGADRNKPLEWQAEYVAAGFPGLGVKTLEKVKSETSSLIDFIDTLWREGDGELAEDNYLQNLTPKQKAKIKAVLGVQWRKKDVIS